MHCGSRKTERPKIRFSTSQTATLSKWKLSYAFVDGVFKRKKGLFLNSKEKKTRENAVWFAKKKQQKKKKREEYLFLNVNMINFYDNFSSEDELESNFLRRGNNHHPHDQGQQRGRPWIDMEAEEHGK